MPVNVKTNDKTTEQLTELSKIRKGTHNIIKSKQDIVADLVDKAHKRECK